MLSLSMAPAVGKKRPFSMPMAARNLRNTLFSKYSYCFSMRNGTFFPARRYLRLRVRPTEMARFTSSLTTGLAAARLSLTAAYTFSQNLGTEHMQVGLTSFTARWISLGLRLMATRTPRVRQNMLHPSSKMWLKGRKLSEMSFSSSTAMRRP